VPILLFNLTPAPSDAATGSMIFSTSTRLILMLDYL
jgi:hypothetical protein